MESITLEMKLGMCGKAKCPNVNREVLVVEYYKGVKFARSRCRACDPRGWSKASGNMAAIGGGVHD